MKQAIKILEQRIKTLNSEKIKNEKNFDKCEMTSDYHFLKNNLENIELEKTELQKAIKKLLS